MLGSRNKRLVGDGLKELSRTLNFRCVEGLAERVIFRELYPRGLTAVDDLDEITFGARPTMSHVSARLEMQNLLSAMLLATRGPMPIWQSRSRRGLNRRPIAANVPLTKKPSRGTLVG